MQFQTLVFVLVRLFLMAEAQENNTGEIRVKDYSDTLPVEAPYTMQFQTLVFVLVRLFLMAEAQENNTGEIRVKDYSEDILISVTPQSDEEIVFLKNVIKINKIDLFKEAIRINDNVSMHIQRSELMHLEEEFSKMNMTVSVEVDNLQRLILQEKNNLSMLSRNGISNPKIYKFDFYHSFENIEVFLNYITKKHNDISRLDIIGYSYEDRPLYLVKISSTPEWLNATDIQEFVRDDIYYMILKVRVNRNRKKIILMDCGMHAREWASIQFCIYFINQLITGYKGNDKNITDALNKYDFFIIPVFNPDGYIYSQTIDRLWRKNRSLNLEFPDCPGVDINRNFDIQDDDDDEKDPCSHSYPGKQMLSEPETASFNDLLEKTSGRLKAYFSFHTYGQYWLFPWAKTDKYKPKNYKDLMRLSRIGASALKERHQTEYEIGSVSEILYIGRGTSMDYLYEKDFAPYSYTIEMRDKGKFAFMLPLQQLLPMDQETTDGVIAAILAME